MVASLKNKFSSLKEISLNILRDKSKAIIYVAWKYKYVNQLVLCKKVTLFKARTWSLISTQVIFITYGVWCFVKNEIYKLFMYCPFSEAFISFNGHNLLRLFIFQCQGPSISSESVCSLLKGHETWCKEPHKGETAFGRSKI